MQFRDLKKQYEMLKPEIDAGIQAVIESSAFILGKPVAELEEELAKYVGRKHCVACASGTDALVLALKVHNVSAGDAVFVPDFTSRKYHQCGWLTEYHSESGLCSELYSPCEQVWYQCCHYGCRCFR